MKEGFARELRWRLRCLSGRSRWLRLLLPVAGVISVLPASASASTVKLRAQPDPVLGDEIRYVAAAGERNQVVVRQLEDLLSPSGGVWVIRDLGASVSPGSWCSAIDEHTARCERARAFPGALGTPVGRYRVSLGDFDDRFEVAPTATQFQPAVVADGGPGNDVILGSDAPGFGGDPFDARSFGDRLMGGGGHDALHGQGGSDFLGDDDLDGTTEGGPDRDVLDGGPGTDVVSYKQRTRPLLVDLADPRPDGERGERDVITDVEGIVGGKGTDQLSGDRRANRIDGGPGADQLAGRDGNDLITRGGRSISCGDGRDTVLGRDAPSGAAFSEREYLEADCETVEPGAPGVPLPAYPASVGTRTVRYEVRCPPSFDSENIEEPAVCSGTVRIRERSAGRRLLARGSFLDLEQQDIVKAKLTPLGRRLVGRRRGVRATIMLSGDGFSSGLRWTIRLALTHPRGARATRSTPPRQVVDTEANAP